MVTQTSLTASDDGDASRVRRRATRWVLLAVVAGVVGLTGAGYLLAQSAPKTECSALRCAAAPTNDFLSVVLPAVATTVGTLLTAVSTVIAVLTYRMARAMQAKAAAPSSPAPSGN